MNLFQRLALRMAFGRKGDFQHLAASSVAGREISPPSTYGEFVKEGYDANVIVFRCINLIATAISELKLCLYSKDREGNRVDATNAEFERLMQRPNPLMTMHELTQAWVSFYLLGGNTFLEATPGFRAKVQELWPVRPDCIRIVPGPQGLPSAYIIKVGDREKSFPVNQVTGDGQIHHTKSFNPSDFWWGMSPIQAAAIAVDSFNQSGTTHLAQTQRAGRPSGVLTYDGAGSKLTEDQKASLKESIRNFYSGRDEQGRPQNALILNKEYTWAQVQLSPEDMQYIASKGMDANDIALAFGVPGQLIGIPGSQTYANFEQALIFFYLNTVLPLAGKYCAVWNHWVLPKIGQGLFIEPDRDAIEALEPLRKQAWDKAQNSSWLTTNEKRELSGYGKLETSEDLGDKVLVDGGKITLEVAEEAIETEPLEDVEDVVATRKPAPEEPGKEGEEDPLEDEESELEEIPEDEAKGQFGVVDGRFFRLDTKASRNGYWVLQERRRMKFERQMTAQMRGYFRKQSTMIAQHLKGTTPSAELFEAVALDAIRATRPLLRKAIEQGMKRPAEAFGKDVLRSEKAWVGFETKAAKGSFEESVDAYIQAEAGVKVSGIEATSRKRVLKAMRDAFSSAAEEGDTLAQVSKAVQQTYAGFSAKRSISIARTETHSAAMFGSETAARELGIPDLQKEWVAAIDERTRESHAAASESKVGLDEQFDVGGDLMDRPGDPGAPPEQVINCRCVLAYSREK